MMGVSTFQINRYVFGVVVIIGIKSNNRCVPDPIRGYLKKKKSGISWAMKFADSIINIYSRSIKTEHGYPL